MKRQDFTLLAGVAAIAVLGAMSANATDTSFTSTGWLVAAPMPGIQCTNSSGQVFLKGNVHVVRLEATDARVTGRLHAWMDMAYQTNGTASFAGPACCQVGTWEGTNFTPSAGVWVLKYSGVANADGSSQYSMSGCGVGGSVDGMRVNVTATRAAPGGPASPYLATGTIRSASVDRLVFSDDFDNNHFDWPSFGGGVGTFAAFETNQQLTLQGTWKTSSSNFNELVAWACPNTLAWALQLGQTIEARVDLVRLGEAATVSGISIYHLSGQAYSLVVSRDWIAIGKQYYPGNAWLRVDKASIPTTNLVFALDITPSGANVVISARVINKSSGAIVIQTSVVDKPGVDATLTSAQVAQLTGLRAVKDVIPDPGAPWTSGSFPLLFVLQDADGTMPPAQATFDNLEMRIYSQPQFQIEPSVRVCWPDTGLDYDIQWAPDPNGPWSPLSDSEMPGMRYTTVPAIGGKGFIMVR